MKVLNDYFLATQTLNSTRDSVYVSSQVSCFKDEHVVENTGIVAFRGKAVTLATIQIQLFPYNYQTLEFLSSCV